MKALSELQSTESYETFQSGNKRKRKVDYPFLAENTYLYKKQKTPHEQVQRGRFGFDQLGILRTKPGLQSSLLSNLFDPIYLDSIIIGDMYDKEALERALYGRLSTIHDLPSPYRLNKPLLFHTSIPFESSKLKLESDNMNPIPCNTALLWVKGMTKSEVYVHGRKQGAPKGKPSNPKTR
ncbi:hypothetical protein BDB01DRAFT_720198 [Pilobolus umbonatus]|nr:hypothetical protein BDB01DRAFT_720198 [Pilobolus umbonatus]